MDRGAWQATVHGSQRARHDWVTNTHWEWRSGIVSVRWRSGKAPADGLENGGSQLAWEVWWEGWRCECQAGRPGFFLWKWGALITSRLRLAAQVTRRRQLEIEKGTRRGLMNERSCWFTSISGTSDGPVQLTAGTGGVGLSSGKKKGRGYFKHRPRSSGWSYWLEWVESGGGRSHEGKRQVSAICLGCKAFSL